MNIITAVANMKFVKIHVNGYFDEPDIEFKFAIDHYDGNCYRLADFLDIITTCKRFGIDHDHLTKHLPALQREYDLFHKMQPEQNIPAAM